MISGDRWNDRCGFTLVELVMVLIILAVLASAALNSVEVQVDQTRFETTQRTTDSVRDAIFDEQLLPDGRTTYSGFLVDMGRPPQTREDAPGVFTASELWDLQTLQEYGSVQALTANITTTDSGAMEDADGDSITQDPAVRLRFGWRGPYLRLASGATELFDGYGHSLTSTNSTLNAHLRGDGDTEVTAVNEEFYGVRSFGRSNVLDSIPNSNATPYENDVPSVEAGQILGSHMVNGTVTGTVTYHTAGVSAADIVVQIYYPNGSQIVVQRASNEAAGEDEIIDITPADATDYSKFQFSFLDAAGEQMDFPVGPRVIRAYYRIGTGDQEQSAVVPFTVVSPMTSQDLAITP